MGRSVSYATGSLAIAYRTIETNEWDSFEYENLVDWIRETARNHWSSFQDCEEWLGREDRAILENELAYIGISEYCGLVSIWLVDRTDRYDGYDDPIANLCEPWCEQIAPQFLNTFSELRKIGTASNGESYFIRS